MCVFFVLQRYQKVEYENFCLMEGFLESYCLVDLGMSLVSWDLCLDMVGIDICYLFVFF